MDSKSKRRGEPKRERPRWPSREAPRKERPAPHADPVIELNVYAVRAGGKIGFVTGFSEAGAIRTLMTDAFAEPLPEVDSCSMVEGDGLDVRIGSGRSLRELLAEDRARGQSSVLAVVF